MSFTEYTADSQTPGLKVIYGVIASFNGVIFKQCIRE